MWTMPLVERHVAPGNDAVVDGAPGPECVERPLVAETDQLLAPQAVLEALVRIPLDRDPVAVLGEAVLRVG
jgi:hypothetical protein